jgi:hypothetical protein
MANAELRGRDAERDALFAALDSACAGHGRAVLLSGPAGIGKSALGDRVALRASERGAHVIRGRAWEFADAPPYFPMSAALRGLGIDAASFMGSPFDLWERVLDALAPRGAARPEVWLIEDVHAADLQTLDLLVFLSQPIRSLPLLVVATARRNDPRIDHRAAQRLTRLARDGLELPLGPLAREDVKALATEVLRRELPTTELDALVARSEGNPLFVVELALSARDVAAPGMPGALPETIRQVVLDRFTRLPDETRRALQAGAILGREFTAGAVARMSDVLPARVVDALLPALRSGMIREEQAGSFSFGHILERDAIEEAMTGAARAAMHERAEVALRAEGDLPQVLLERARHAIAGAHPGNESEVLALAARAIAALEARGAHDRAFALAQRLEVARATGEVATAASPEEQLRMAGLAERAGRYTECRRICGEVASHARASGDVRLLAQAALVWGSELRPGLVDRDLVSLLEEARRALDDCDPALACRVDGRLAAAQQPSQDAPATAAFARDVLARARSLGDDALLGELLVTAGAAIVDYVPVSESASLARELLAYALRTGDLHKVLRARARLAMDLVGLRDLAGFTREVDALLDVSRELGLAKHRWRPLLMASMRACMQGEFRESERLLVEVQQLAFLVDDPALGLSLSAHRMMRSGDVDSLATVRDLLGDVGRLVAGVPEHDKMAALTRADMRARAGDREGVAADLRVLEPVLPRVIADLSIAGMLVEPVAIAGTASQKAMLRDRLRCDVDRDVTGGHISVFYMGPATRLIGLLDAALGDLPSAEISLRSALEHVRAHGLRPWIARTSAELGEVLRRSGRSSDATALFEEAQTLARDLGMANLVERLSAATPARSVPDAVRSELLLEREGETWRVARGAAVVRVRDSRGMRLLARLVAQSGEEIHVLLLASDEGSSMAESHAGDRLDDKALRTYRTRLAELGREIDEAREAGDLGRAGRLERERGAIEAELSGGLGLSGKARKAGSVTERARINVQKRLKDAIARIHEADPALGTELETAVRTGTYCSYRP